MTSTAASTTVIQTRYSGRAEQIYIDICFTLSERIDQVDWAAYTPKDWSVLARMAEAEGVAPLMYWNLKDHRSADDQYDVPGLEVPLEIFHRLKASYYNTLAQNTLMYQELERILTALDVAGIPVIVLKGAALAATLYEDIGLRPMGDLDLLVEESNYDIALSIVKSIGYIDEPMLSARLNNVIGFNIHLWKDNYSGIKLEIHKGLIQSGDGLYAPSMEWFWSHAEHFDKKKKGINCQLDNSLSLSSIANIVYLSAHQTIQHDGAQSRLIWHHDIHILVREAISSQDWRTIIKQAHIFGWSYGIYYALIMVQTLFQLRIPRYVLGDLYEDQTPYKAILIDQKVKSKQTNISRFWYTLLMLNWRSRFLFVTARIFPSNAYLRWFYGFQDNWYWPLYYPYHWSIMTLKVLGTVKSHTTTYLRNSKRL